MLNFYNKNKIINFWMLFLQYDILGVVIIRRLGLYFEFYKERGRVNC